MLYIEPNQPGSKGNFKSRYQNFILEKSFDPRKTQKARKYSKRYQVVDRHPKGE